MVKVALIVSVLLVSTAFGQRGQRQNYNNGYGDNRQPGNNNQFGGFGGYGNHGNNQFGGPGGFGGQPGNQFGGNNFGAPDNRFGGRDDLRRPGDFRHDEFGGPYPGHFPGMGSEENNFGGKGPGGRGHHHGSHGPHGQHLPPFLKDATEEQRKEFFDIVKNHNLTKAEMKTELQQWANNAGGNISAMFNEMEQKHEEMKQKISEKANEIIANVTKLIQQITEIKNNMEITKDDEMQQIKALFNDQSIATAKAAKAIGLGAIKEAARSKDDVIPTIPTDEPEILPSSQ